jgi:hypothetical protein
VSGYSYLLRYLRLVLVALSQDRRTIREAVRQQIGIYETSPFYASMFADAGFPVEANGRLSNALVDSLVLLGDEDTVATRFKELLAQGLGELVVASIPVADERSELTRLMYLIGQL